MLQNIFTAHYFFPCVLCREIPGAVIITVPASEYGMFLYIRSVRCVELLTFLSVYDGSEYQTEGFLFWIL